MRFKYEEESHYYVDVLCDDFCEIGNNNEIVLVQDEQLNTIDSQQSETKDNLN